MAHGFTRSTPRFPGNSPAQITANQNDYDAGIYAGTLRASCDADGRRLTGILDGQDGRLLYVVNVGTKLLVLRHQDTGSAAANRILLPFAFDLTLGAEEIATLLYDATTARWRVASPHVCPGTITLLGQSTVPVGYVECDGSAINRTTYSGLFAVIGTTWGAGNGSTTFNVPDFRSRSPVGAGQGSGLTNRTLGGTGGAETHALVTGELASHAHGITLATGNGTTTVSGTAVQGNNAIHSIAAYFSIAAAASGSGTAHANMHPWAAAKFIIKI